MADTKGYESSTPDSANSPNYPSYQEYQGPGTMAKAVKARFKNLPEAFPYGKNDEGGK